MNTFLDIADVREKMARVDADLHTVLLGVGDRRVPLQPARDIRVQPVRQHPDKAALHLAEGQARLLHDLASIELQALELGMRTLLEFPDAPPAFRHELADITRGEARHLQLCLDGIQALGFQWGHWPVHVALWDCVGAGEGLLDRILIVHRYLEGSGLDAGESIQRRLSGVVAPQADEVVGVIVREEVDHVRFGSDWYRNLCAAAGLDAADDFEPRLNALRYRLPRRMEALSRPLRSAAGFTDAELDCLDRLRSDRLREGRRGVK
ncbi:MAG: DUF455 family protein [Bdellovibrionales bacterium]|nr:DUF455 family protein [Bdellovibrionales bacterium]